MEENDFTLLPLAILGNGGIYRHRRRSSAATGGIGLLPTLFGWRQITFWQSGWILALCRILFGGLDATVSIVPISAAAWPSAGST